MPADAPDFGRVGKIVDEAIESYHENPAVSKSKIDDFRRSPRLFHRKHILKIRKEKTAALDFGSAFDRMILEPHLPALKFRTSPDQEKADAMKAVIWSKPHLLKMIREGEKQVTFRHSFGSYAVQCRPDIWLPNGCPESEGRPCVVDLKSIADLDDVQGSGFQWAIRDYGYHRSVAFTQEVIHYVTGVEELVDYLFLVSEKAEPYDSMLLRISPDDVALGRQQVTEDLAAMKVCYETGVWPGCADTVQTAYLPYSRPTSALMA